MEKHFSIRFDCLIGRKKIDKLILFVLFVLYDIQANHAKLRKICNWVRVKNSKE